MQCDSFWRVHEHTAAAAAAAAAGAATPIFGFCLTRLVRPDHKEKPLRISQARFLPAGCPPSHSTNISPKHYRSDSN